MMKDNLIIRCPSVTDINKKSKFSNAFAVDDNQPDSIYKAVEQMAHYFKKENNYDFSQYAAFEDKTNKNSHAYIWTDSNWEDDFAVGAASFRFLADVHQSKVWSLDWVWIHPYYRNQGLLTQCWPEFVKKYGKDFRVEHPLSREMEQFLKKMNHKIGEAK